MNYPSSLVKHQLYAKSSGTLSNSDSAICWDDVLNLQAFTDHISTLPAGKILLAQVTLGQRMIEHGFV